MSRGFEPEQRSPDERESKREPQSRMALSQGRGGSGETADRRRRPTERDIEAARELIDQATQGRPTVTEFFARLESLGVRPVASVQANGRWNGVVYEHAGRRIKGSHLGRAYTAKGLQERRGIRYEPDRDDETLARSAGEPPERTPIARDERRPPQDRARGLDGLNADQRAVMWDVGRFRVVAAKDLVASRYGGQESLLNRDLKHLLAEGLVERRVVPVNSRGATITVLALTQRGKAAAKRLPQNDSGKRAQALYTGFVKPREVVHDAALYRVFQAEAARIERSGGRVRRVVLDFELKKKAYAELAEAADLPPLAYAERQQEIAAANGLQVVDGHLVLPDLRVEYETAERDERHVDLELATKNYRAAHVASKAAAGFRIYADSNNGALASVFDNHDLIAELLR